MRPKAGWPPEEKDDQGNPLTESMLVELLTDKGCVRMDPLVVRGYLGSTVSPIVQKALDAVPEKIRKNLCGLDKWRIYLSPRLDRYVEFAKEDVVGYSRESDPHEEDVYTVWLENNKEYMVTTIRPLRAPNGFLRGDLLEDYLGQPQSRQVAWDGQDYGMPATGGGQSKTPCSGY